VKLPADKLASQLGKGLASVYFVTGKEPLLVGEAIDKIRSAARQQGYDERDAYTAEARFDWKGTLAGLDNLSLFASRKIVEVRLPTGKPGQQGAAALTDLVSNPPPDTLFILSAPYLDKRTTSSKWAKALQADGVWVTVPEVYANQLPGWIAARLKAAGLTFDREIVDVLASRVEGNLLAAQQEINKLALLADDGRVTEEVVRQSVADGSRFDVYQLADAALAQDFARAARVLLGLRREGVAAPLVLWAIAREVNVLVSLWASIDQGTPAAKAMTDARIWRNKQSVYGRALQSHNEASIRKMVECAGRTDRVVKGAASGQPWNALLELAGAVACPGRFLTVATI